jgi:hypothetical protein
MPKKTPESIREQVVALRKAGNTYTQIEAQVVNPETGRPIQRPTTIKILKEAGLTRAASSAARAGTGPASSPSPRTAAGASGVPPAATSSVPLARGNGVDEFMPKVKAQAKAPAAPVDFECEHCGAEFTADSEADVPETCPECGN